MLSYATAVIALCFAGCVVNAQLFCLEDASDSWNYRGLRGPWSWSLRFPTCGGRNQSPINIQTSDISCSDLEKLTLVGYEVPVSSATMVNNGHTAQVSIDDGVTRGFTVGDKTYTLAQVHFHWGSSSDKGSEHLIDGQQYALEAHFVHSHGESGELAVVGVLYEEGSKLEGMEPIVESLKDIVPKGSETTLKDNLILRTLVPENPLSYYRYNGSLTTPECNEGVLWSVAKEVMQVSNEQLEEFRKLRSNSNDFLKCNLVNNFRPVQPLCDRQVCESA